MAEVSSAKLTLHCVIMFLQTVMRTWNDDTDASITINPGNGKVALGGIHEAAGKLGPEDALCLTEATGCDLLWPD